jgi:hypothetical protein
VRQSPWSSEPVTSGFRLCFAVRPAGLAFSSGFAWLIGCPGGAEGFLMLSKTGRFFLSGFFRRDSFVAISTASYVPMINSRGFLWMLCCY